MARPHAALDGQSGAMKADQEHPADEVHPADKAGDLRPDVPRPRHPTARQALGKWGEDQAADYLRQRGYQILEQNVRTPYGEIDLVACQTLTQAPGQTARQAASLTIVFVEVKTRRSTAFGLPEEAITARKRQHLLAAAQAYLLAHPDLDADWRLDVIAIQRSPSSSAPIITHFENAITGE
jgi:putative endonuclease